MNHSFSQSVQRKWNWFCSITDETSAACRQIHNCLHAPSWSRQGRKEPSESNQRNFGGEWKCGKEEGARKGNAIPQNTHLRVWLTSCPLSHATALTAGEFRSVVTRNLAQSEKKRRVQNYTDEATGVEEGRQGEHQRTGELEDGSRKGWKAGRKCRNALCSALEEPLPGRSDSEQLAPGGDRGETNGSRISSVDTRAKFNCQSDNEKIVRVTQGRGVDYSLHRSLLWQVGLHCVSRA